MGEIGQVSGTGDQGQPMTLPPPSLTRIADASAGLIGVQIVWGLQNVSTSRIFQAFGAGVGDLPILWIAAPVTGLMVQPVVGWLGDRRRTRFGRRRPYLAAGALLTAVAMVAMAQATSLAAAVAALWLLTASVNVAMQPLRAMLAEIVPVGQRATGYAVQVVFIGVGAVFASCLPWLLAHAGAAQPTGSAGPATGVRAAFWIGAGAMLFSTAWTLVRTREPDVAPPEQRSTAMWRQEVRSLRGGGVWMAVAIVLVIAAQLVELRREVYLLALIAGSYGGLRFVVTWRCRRGRPIGGLLEIVYDITVMPLPMRRLALTQFLTWFGLFALWIYAVPAVASRYFDTADPTTLAYNAAADWVGVLFALHDGVATAAALLLPRLVARLGVGRAHAACLAVGASGLAATIVMPGPYWLWLPSLAIGIAWASILSAPYALVAEAAPPDRLGVYLGIHNIFLVLPQLVAAAILGVLVNRLLGGTATAMLPLAAMCLAAAAATALRLPGAAEQAVKR